MNVLFHFRLHQELEDEYAYEFAPALFHKWLPDGEKDAITILENDSAKIWVWFERSGDSSSGVIHFTQEGSQQSFDTEIMKRQARLVAGSLHAKLSLFDCTSVEIEALSNGEMNEEAIRLVAIRAAKKIGDPIANFIEVLRARYGQFWIPSFEKWDSQKHTIETYFRVAFDAGYSTDSGNSFAAFLPGHATYIITGPRMEGKGWAEFLEEADWRSLQKSGIDLRQVSIAESLIAAASKYAQSNQLRQAIIEAVTAIEIASSEYIHRCTREHQNRIQAFFDLSLSSRIAILLSSSKLATDKEISSVIRTIEIRNKVVHKGYFPTSTEDAHLRTTMIVTARLLGNEKQKLPTFNFSNNRIDRGTDKSPGA
jgi:hypothetical protein